jgi:MFS family permease
MESLTHTTTKVDHQRDRGIAICVTTLAIAAMVVDHLLGDDPGLEDPPMFAIACAVTLGLSALVFGRIVPRAQRANREARDGLILSIVAIVPGIATLWLGPPFVLAGGGLALGLHAWSVRDRRGVAAVALAVLMLGFGTVAYSVQLVDKLG